MRISAAIAAIMAMVVTLLLAPPPPAAQAVTDDDPSFVLTQNDLEFILRQIQISEAHAADELNPSNYELYCPGQGTAAQNCVPDIMRPAGVRTVDGSYNNLVAGRGGYGSSDVAFPRLLPELWRQAEPEALDLGFEANTPEQVAVCGGATTCYSQTDGNVYDSQPREISNLIVDQTTSNPAIQNQIDAGTAIPVPGTDRVTIPNTAPDEELSAPFNTFMGFFGQFFDHGLDLVGKGGNGTMIVPLETDDPLYCIPDTTPAGNPLGGVRANAPGAEEVHCNPEANFVTLSRATRIDDANGDPTNQHKNITSPFIDQNQTYSSHPAHQVFLREYATVDGVPQATGLLIEGVEGGMSTWADVKAQTTGVLGLPLTDADLLDVPQVVVDPYGNFVPGENGFPMYVIVNEAGETDTLEGAPGGATIPAGWTKVGTGHAFLDDIAHGSTPVVGEDGALLPRFNEDGTPVLDENGEPVLTGYDNATLNAHFMAGDGRVNENIGLTAVHAVFHAEHNRMVGQILEVLDGARPELEAQDSAERGGIAEFAAAFRGENHAYASDRPEDQLPGYVPVGSGAAPVAGQADDWSFEERLFQAAKFATEMQYQHLVFEEFGRKISPTIDAVVFNENSYNADINAAITAEFAHVVYRFGHSMMTEEIGREPLLQGGSGAIEPDGAGDVPLLTGFLNPDEFDHSGTLSPEEAAGTLINGMTSRVGSQIDEHVVDVLRNNLLGLPLDLATLNLLRGRDAGVPSLQTARQTFYEATGDDDLRPYVSWNDFGLNTKNGNNFGRAGERASLVNFVAAYGTHPTITEAETLAEKRNAAALLVNGAPLGEEFVLRIAGADRFQTAARISERQFPAGGPVPVVYITDGMKFPDALAGGAAARAEGGPILLVANRLDGDIPLATALELERLQPERIVVLGDTNSVTAATINNLRGYTSTDEVTTIGGVNRFETAALISERTFDPGVPRVFVADGYNYPDALAAAAVAARDGVPILITPRDALDPYTAAELDRLDPEEIVVLGGAPSISSSTFGAISQYGPTRRIAGADRFETAVEISREFFPDGADRVYLTNGRNFPDALAAGPAAGLAGAPILLTEPGSVPAVVLEEIERLGVAQIHVLGDPNAVSLAAEAQVAVFAPPSQDPPADRVEFMNSTGAWAGVESGLNNVDFWVGGLAERLNPFGGMLGSTFNFVFETQLEKLQFGDRFYYLFRNQGEQLFAALEGNTFSDIIQRNTDASNLPADIFALQDPILDVDDYIGGEPLPAGLILEGDGTYRWSGDEHVQLHGSAEDDRLRGDEGDDAVWGYAGNDRIEGGSGNDALVGGSGDDIITDAFGDDNLKGKQGNDVMHNGPGDDLSIGGLGDDFMINGGGDATTLFAGMGDDITLGTTGRTTVFGGEHDDWVEGSSHADLLQGDNADQAQNDTLGGNDVVIGRFGNDDIEGEGGDDIIVGTSVGTDRHLGNLGFDWLTYYGTSEGVVSDWAFNRVFETQNQLASRFDLLEALSGSTGNDVLRGPLVEPDDFTTLSEAPLNKATEASLDLVDGLEAMLRPTATPEGGEPIALGDFALPILRDAPEIDADGVHKVMIAGPGSDTVEGRGGNDYLDGDAMLRVQLEATLNDGTVILADSAAQLQNHAVQGRLNPSNIDIIRAIDIDREDAGIDTVQYADVRAAYAISEIGFEGSGYWSVTHTAVQEAEESDGTDTVVGFERMQFADGCAELIEGEWVSCLPSAFVQMAPMDPIEGQPVTATLWQDEAFTVDFDESTVTNLLYTWWAGEGDTADTVGEWEVLVTSPNATYTPDQSAVGQFLRVTVGYTDPTDGQFRAARSAVSTSQVQDVQQNGTLALQSVAPFVVGVPIIPGVPDDPDGLFEEGVLTYQWARTTGDPADPATVWENIAEPAGTTSAYAPVAGDVGYTIRVTIGYTDGAETAQSVSVYTSEPVSAAPTP
ncbi:cell wall-binding repeat-containing protein [Microbacterium sp. NPDC056569]|uniref:cell wall-binding repeat-containing protein n=1 Tax=Microbacterium sp. NPDC056569 TaxID=3345867 RepID=UPI00366CBCD0